MNLSLKNWKPKEVIQFLMANGFVQIKIKKSGDHKCFFNKNTGAYTEIDMGKKSFSAREMLTLSKQSKILRAFWKK
jgi:predicted RNA binding protein YcfA (HicA-like mRNA interferase family)